MWPPTLDQRETWNFYTPCRKPAQSELRANPRVYTLPKMLEFKGENSDFVLNFAEIVIVIGRSSWQSLPAPPLPPPLPPPGRPHQYRAAYPNPIFPWFYPCRNGLDAPIATPVSSVLSPLLHTWYAGCEKRYLTDGWFNFVSMSGMESSGGGLPRLLRMTATSKIRSKLIYDNLKKRK